MQEMIKERRSKVRCIKISKKRVMWKKRQPRTKPKKQDEEKNGRKWMEEEDLTDGRNGSDDLTKLQLVEDGCFPCSIEADHEDAHLPLGKQALEELGEREAHCRKTSWGSSFSARHRKRERWVSVCVRERERVLASFVAMSLTRESRLTVCVCVSVCVSFLWETRHREGERLRGRVGGI